MSLVVNTPDRLVSQQDQANDPETPSPPATNTRTGSPMWWRVGLGATLLLAAVARLWGASEGRYGNLYYSSAALSMSKNPIAFLFGSVDAQHFITVDKPAVALWPSAV